MQMLSTHRPNSVSLLEQIQTVLLYGLMAIVSLSFLPTSSSFFDDIRIASILLTTALSLGIWSARAILTKRITITLHPLLVPLTLLMGSVILSTAMGSRHVMASLNGLPSAMLSLLILAIISPTTLRDAKARFLDMLLGIGVVLAIFAGLQSIGAGPSVLINALFSTTLPNTFGFSLAGSPLVALSLLTTIAAGTIARLWKKPLGDHPLLVAGSIVLVVGIGLHLVQMRPGSSFSPFVLPYGANWIIVTDTFKSAPSAIWGVGPNSFSDAYTIFRPVSLNATRSWNVVYETGSNTPLTLMVTLGALGFLTWCLLAFRSLRLLRSTTREQLPLGIFVASTFVAQLIFPLNLPLLALQLIGMTFWLSTLKNEQTVVRDLTLNLQTHSSAHDAPKGSGVLSWIAATLGGAIAVALVWFAQLSLRADIAFARSMQAFTNGDGGQAYQLQQQALAINPYLDKYHTAFADTNFAIAQALSAQKDLTDEQRQQITQLIQQSLQAIRIATQINPFSSNNWAIMGTLYSQLIGSVEQADDWAAAGYIRAITAHPHNPLLRIQLGTIFYQAENYQQAVQLFSQAAQLKPDLAAAYYNLAKSLDKAGDTQQAIVAYQQLLALMNTQDEAYMDIEAELNSLLERAKTEIPNTPENQDAAPQAATLPPEIADEAKILEQEPPQATSGAIIDTPTTPAPTPVVNEE